MDKFPQPVEMLAISAETMNKQLELLKEYRELLESIMGSRKVSIGHIDNTYIPQLSVHRIQEQHAKLMEVL